MEKTFREAIQTYIAAEAIPREKFGHQPRLYALTRMVGEGRDYDDDVVAAAWLHDLGCSSATVPKVPRNWRGGITPPMQCAKAPELLIGFGFSEAKIPAVVEAIRTHQPQAEPATIEGLIMRDADILEQLGTIAVLRTVCKIGRDTRFETFDEALNSLRKSLETLPAQLRLETSRTLARPKIQVLELFLAAAESELGGPGLRP